MSTYQPALAWRQSEKNSAWLGRRGQVLAATLVGVGLPDLSHQAPYWLVMVEFGSGVRRLLLGVDGESFARGEKVEVVWRRYGGAGQSVIRYGLKVKHAA